MRVAAIALVAVASCGHPAPTPVVTSNQPTGGGGASRALPSPTAAWSYDYPDYFSGGDLRASVFAADVVVLAKEFDGGQLIGLDPATGAVRFQIDGITALRADDGGLYAVGLDAAPGTFGGNHAIAAIDPATGAVLRTVALTPALPRFPMMRFVIAGARLIAIGDGELAAYDLASGRQLWHAADPDASHLFAPAVLADRVILSNSTYSAYALADGALMWKRPGQCCALGASPDGEHVYVRSGLTTVGELGPDGAVVSTRPGALQAVARDWVAIADGDTLSVYRHGAATPSLQITAPPDGVGAVGLHDDWLFYFDGRDATMWMHDVVTDRRVALRQASSRFVVSPDATGTAPAYIGDPPAVALPNLYVLDWELHAYQVDRGK